MDSMDGKNSDWFLIRSMIAAIRLQLESKLAHARQNLEKLYTLVLAHGSQEQEPWPRMLLGPGEMQSRAVTCITVFESCLVEVQVDYSWLLQ